MLCIFFFALPIKVLEGEVVQVEVDRPASGVGPKVGKLTLKTTDMEAVYDIGNKMVETVIKERITAGDVVSVDKGSGFILINLNFYSKYECHF